VSNFSPPSGGKAVMRPVHPNFVIAGFTLIAIFFLIQIYTNQPELFFPILISGFRFLYWVWNFRKTIYTKYNKQIQENMAIKKTYEAAIGKWMHLVLLCTR
jgi:ABC-type bacteriocin/lantibiotic exporter with double-glycine peptidase domain